MSRAQGCAGETATLYLTYEHVPLTPALSLVERGNHCQVLLRSTGPTSMSGLESYSFAMSILSWV